MVRQLVAAALLCAVASAAQAKDVCIAIDTSSLTLVMRGVKTARGSFGPVHGYINNPDPVTTQNRISPVDGQVLVSSTGVLAAGLAWHEVALYPSGGANVLNDLIAVNLSCSPGEDAKLGVGDVCDAYVSDTSSGAHVISCKEAARIP
jgi:hypothetical protein